MSSSGRLAKLKRSVAPMVSDVNSSVQQNNLRSQNLNTEEPPRNMVEPMTILTWHEQRLNKIDEMLANMQSPEMNQAEVVVPIVESIEVLESHIKALQRQVDELKKNQKMLDDAADYFRKKAKELNIKGDALADFNLGIGNLVDLVFKADMEAEKNKS